MDGDGGDFMSKMVSFAESLIYMYTCNEVCSNLPVVCWFTSEV